MDTLLVEVFVEELPPKVLQKLGDAFAAGLASSLKAQDLAPADAAVTAYASPRRLAAQLVGVAGRAADRPVQTRLMPASVALDAAGQPTPALLKKLATLGLDSDAVPRLRRASDGKAEVLFIDTVQAGPTLAQGLQKALDETLARLPIPKVMQYQLADGWSSVQFVRPAHGLVALHGQETVAVTALGLQSGRTTRGHRFESGTPTITLRAADTYAEQLRDEGAVMAGFGERRAELVRQLAAAAEREGLRPIDDEALVDEVTALVERPNVLLCRFEPAFLAVPQECLILTMKANQKYFPLLDANGSLTEKFLVVSNIRPADPSRVIEGNERVVRPRLADARFFFDQDRKRTLESRVPQLARVVYHGQLGSQLDRVERVRAIARGVAGGVPGEPAGGIPSGMAGANSGAEAEAGAIAGAGSSGMAVERPGHALGTGLPEAAGGVLSRQVDRAALLAKADLLSDMVGEFPELQGVMGGYYARHDGEPEAVAVAIEDHYKPRFAGDALPRGDVALVVALADKLETLAGLFLIGQVPTGDKDPYALRRHALGVIRMLSGGGTAERAAWPLHALLTLAVGAFSTAPAATAGASAAENSGASGSALADAAGNAVAALADFIYDRLRGVLRDEGYAAVEIDAVVSQRPQHLGDVARRLRAVRIFAALAEAPALAAANKRVANILRKSEAASGSVDEALLIEPAEQALRRALQDVVPAADAACDRGDYTASLQALAVLKAPVDAFFDTVMVNADDPALRRNRLALLAGLHAAMNRVADLSRLAA